MQPRAIRLDASNIIHDSSQLVGITVTMMALATICHSPAPNLTIAIPVRYTDIRQVRRNHIPAGRHRHRRKVYLETMGTGVAWLDYDQDGLMDLYFVQSAATDIYKPPQPLRCALYHNNGDGTFTDVTKKAGVGGEDHYGQGVTVGDFDNDGYPDLVTG